MAPRAAAPQPSVLERAGGGVEEQAGGPGGGGVAPRLLVERRGLGHRNGLGDVQLPGAQGVGAGGAVGDETGVDAGGLGAPAPVVVEPVEGGGGGAVDLGQFEGPGGVADGIDTVLVGVGLAGQDGEARAGQPQRQHRVGLGGGDPDHPLPLRLRAEGDTGEGGGRGLRVGGAGEGVGDRGRGDVAAVLEGGVAEGELPGLVPVPAPGLGECGGGGAVGVEGGEALGDTETAEEGGVGAVRGEVLGGREGEGDAEPGPVPAATVPGVVTASGGEAACYQRGEHEGGEQPGAAVGAHGPRIGRVRAWCGDRTGAAATRAYMTIISMIAGPFLMRLTASARRSARCPARRRRPPARRARPWRASARTARHR